MTRYIEYLFPIVLLGIAIIIGMAMGPNEVQSSPNQGQYTHYHVVVLVNGRPLDCVHTYSPSNYSASGGTSCNWEKYNKEND